MNQASIIALLVVVIFFCVMGIYIILVMGGHTFRQHLKSKLPGLRKKGSWHIHFRDDNRVRLDFKVLPKDMRLKIKAGKQPEDDQFSTVKEVVHIHDTDGSPIVTTMDGLPFDFFVKKLHLSEDITSIDDFVKAIDEIIEKKDMQQADELKLMLKKYLATLTIKIKYIADGVELIRNILFLEQTREYMNKPAILLLPAYKTNLLRLKDVIIERNETFVNVYDLFRYSGYVENITKIAFQEFQNGVLAAKQTLGIKVKDYLLIILLVATIIMMIVSITTMGKINKTLEGMDLRIAAQSKDVNKIRDYLLPVVDVNGVIVPNTNQTNIPVNPLGNNGK